MKFYRRLGATEHAIWLRDRVTPLHFALTAQVQGTIESEILHNALNRLQHRHPLLRVKIALEQNGTPYFVEQSAPIPCRIIPRLGETHWQTEAARELSHPFDWSEAPLIRVVLLSTPEISELIVVCHHAIADGKAVVNLIQELLSLITHPNPEVSRCPVPPSLETLVPDYQPVSRIQKLLVSGVCRWQQFRQHIKPVMKADQSASSLLQVDAGCLSPETTKQLIHRCRQEETTVHAAICTAWLWAIALQHQRFEQPLHCFSPINLRPYLVSPLEQECGLYISPAQTSHTIAPESQFWPMARSFKSDLRVQVEANLIQQVHRHEALMAAKPSPEFVHHLFTHHCNSEVMVTNLGHLAIPQHYGSLFLKAIYGPLVLSGFEQERVCGVATLGDRLFYTVIHHRTDPESILVQQMRHLLEMAISLMPNLTLSSITSIALPELRSFSPTQSARSVW